MKKNTVLLLLATAFSVLTANAEQPPYPYQDTTLSVDQRVDDLLSRLTIQEKAQLMMNRSKAVTRLGIAETNWWSEALHGVGRNGLSTVFPSCIGMASSFNDELLARVFTAVSDEARAKNTAHRQAGKTVGQYQGLSFWTPNINIFRDPRWGRGQETYGEDPYQNGRMGSIVVRALQGTLDPSIRHKHFKLLACAKHFAVHSGPEKSRHQFNIEDLPARDLWETYLPAFKTLVQEADVQEVMCAYQRFEGSPCCGSNRLLQQILREEWGYKGLVVSDCGAIDDFWKEGRHGTSVNSTSASAKAVVSGTDVECGSNFKELPIAVRSGYVSEEQVDQSMRRLLRGRFLLGEFDSDDQVDWTQIPMSVVASPEHKRIALEMARQQMVLLKNNGILPLKKDGKKLMVMGPNAADSTMLWSIYFGEPSHTVTPLEGIRAKVGNILFTPACTITDFTDEHPDVAAVLKAAQKVKTVIFVGGISPNLEREEARTDAPGFDGGDRTSIELPQVQRDILRALHEAGKKIVFVCCSGSAVALTPEVESCDAIIEAWYAGEQGGHALADVLFGDYSPCGKLPVTFYRNDSQLPAFEDYRMQGRTYRYFRGAPLFPFGFGLSYTTFKLSKPQAVRTDNGYQITTTLKNTGKRDGAEVVQLYLRRPADTNGPLKTLRGYERVELKAGESRKICIDMPRKQFEVWDVKSNTMRVLPGTYELLMGTSSADADLQKMTVSL